MKKLLLIFLFFPLSVFAEEKELFVNFGYLSGLNRTFINTDDPVLIQSASETERNSGYSFIGGFFMNAQILEKFSIQCELLYNSKTYYHRSYNLSGQNKLFRIEELSVDFIEVPLLFMANHEMDRKALHFFGGMSVAFRSRASYFSSIDNIESGEVIRVKDNSEPEFIRESFANLIGGAEFTILTDKFRYLFDLRYQYSLSPIINDKELNNFSNPNPKFHTVSFLLGIFF